MARSNRTELAILGLLAREPMSGYDIRGLVEERLSHFWHESLGHIYPVLKRLHERGWVEKRVEEGRGAPPRHEYSITPAGRDVLEGWFADPIEPVPPRNELLLRIYFGRFADPAALAEQVREYRATRSAQLARFEQIAERLDREAPHDPDRRWWLMTLKAGIHAARAALAWCDDVLPDLESER